MHVTECIPSWAELVERPVSSVQAPPMIAKRRHFPHSTSEAMDAVARERGPAVPAAVGRAQPAVRVAAGLETGPGGLALSMRTRRTPLTQAKAKAHPPRTSDG
jgi:hypothetical protein